MKRRALYRALVASLLLHLLLAFLFSLWVVSEAIYRAATNQPLELAVDADALAQERLALEIREQLMELPGAPPPVAATQVVIDRQPLPEIAMVQQPATPVRDALPPQVFAVDAQKPVEAKAAERLPATDFRLPPAHLTSTAEMEMRQQKLRENSPELKPLASESPNPAPEKITSPLIAGRPVEMVPAPPDVPVRQNPSAPFDKLPVLAPEAAARLASAAPPTVKWGPDLLALVQMESGRPQPDARKSPEIKPLDPAAGSAVAKVEMSLPGGGPPQTPVPALTMAPQPPTAPSAPPLQPQPSAPALSEITPLALTATKLPQLPPRPDIKLEAPAQMSSRYMLRDPHVRERVIKELGGSEETEAAIKRSLDWFTRNQEPDGRWSINRFGGQNGHDVAATGLATLCYFGWGSTHLKDGPHREPVRRAIKWLVGKMREDGDLRGDGGNMYDHGIAAIALAEAYGVTKDPDLRQPVERVTGFIVRAQNPQSGGWRYHPGEAGDTSISGWQVMALKSAELAGIPVPARTFELTDRWLDSIGGGQHAGLYGYQDRNPKPAMVAEAMFARQLLGTPRESPDMQESAAFLKTALPEPNRISLYYWYYGSLALFQHQGPVWEEWNRRLRTILVSSQKRSGNDDGSWDPSGEWANESGRVVSTAMATLSVEVYYRYLPIYGNPATVR